MPLLLSIPMTVLTSKVGVGTTLRANNYLLIPEETKSPAVLRRAWQLASQPAKPPIESCPRCLNASKGLAGIFLLLN